MGGDLIHKCNKEKEITTVMVKVDKIEETLKETKKEIKENHADVIDKIDEHMQKIDRDYVKKIEFNQYKSRADDFMDKRQMNLSNWLYHNTGTAIVIITIVLAGIGKINGWY